jgi:hypothetical protein
MDLLSCTDISIPSTAEELLASYNSQAAELLNAYEEELYLSAESERNNSSIPAADVNSYDGFGVHGRIKSCDDTLQIDSQHSAVLAHDPINCDGANYEDEAGFCAFESLVDYPDDECLAAIDAANRNPARPHIKRGTDSMPAYKGPNNALGEPEDTSTVVQLGHTLLRHDLEESTKGSLRAWLRGGLWPLVNHSATYEEDIGEQCSLDMMQAEVEEDVEAKLMLRQIARVRLYHRYTEQKRRIKDCRSPKNMGVKFDEEVETIDRLLERFYADWTRRMKKRKGPFVVNSTSRKASARDGVS